MKNKLTKKRIFGIIGAVLLFVLIFMYLPVTIQVQFVAMFGLFIRYFVCALAIIAAVYLFYLSLKSGEEMKGNRRIRIQCSAYKVLIFALISAITSTMNAQTINLDSLEYTTAKVDLVAEKGTGCHVAMAGFQFKVLQHISGPKIEKNTLVTSLLLRAATNGDATKLRGELYHGKDAKKGESNELVMNFTYNPEPKSPDFRLVAGCTNPENYADYGLSYIRWAVREERLRDMRSLEYFMNKNFKKKFHLMAEREGKFVFEHEGKQLLAFLLYNEWKLAEIKEEPARKN